MFIRYVLWFICSCWIHHHTELMSVFILFLLATDFSPNFILKYELRCPLGLSTREIMSEVVRVGNVSTLH